MEDQRVIVPEWFCPQLTFNPQNINISLQSKPDNFNPAEFHRDACYADYIACLLHLIFACFSLSSLIIMSCYYRTKGIKHSSYTQRYPLHICRWLLFLPFIAIMLASITEGILSDMKIAESTSSPHLYLTSILASIAGLMAMVYYHNMEVWNQVSMVMMLFAYWFGALGSEAFRFYKWLDNPDHVDVRIMKFDCFIITVVIYASFLLVECLSMLMQIYGRWHRKTTLENDLQKSNMRFYHQYANLFSASTFWWLHWLLSLGYKRPLQMSDLGCLPKRHSSKQNRAIFSRVLKEEKMKSIEKGKDLGLYTVYRRVHGSMHLLTFFIKIVADCLSFVGPVAVGRIVQYVTHHYYGTVSDWDEMSDYVTVSEFFHNGFALVIVMFLCSSIRGLFLQNHHQIVSIEGIHLSAEIQSAVYEKSLHLSSWSMNGGPMTIGEITNHISTDARHLINLSNYIHYVWSMPFQIAVIMWLLYHYLGASALVGATMYLIGTPIQFMLAGMQAKVQKSALEVSDDRLKRTHELLLGMKLIKLCGWEEVFFKAISTVRKSEIARLTKGALIQAAMFFMINATPVFVTLVSFTLYSKWSNKPLTPDIAFSSLALVNQLAPAVLLIPMVTMHVVLAHISTKRLQKFFMADELESNSRKMKEEEKDARCDPVNGQLPDVDVKPQKQKETTHFSRLNDDDDEISEVKEDQSNNGKEYMQLKQITAGDDDAVSHLPGLPDSVALKIQEASFVWDPEQKEAILSNINIEIPKGQLTMIIGPVGAGKSSILSAILCEMTNLQGKVQWNRMTSSVAYSAQKSWLLNASLRDNILFGEEFDHQRFQSVVSACCLQPDIDILPAGDQTEIGEKGINLSGGQKQRVSVARALYSSHQTVLLDDPFASLDVHVGSKLFHQAIMGLLLENHRTVILVTHQLKFLQYAQQVILMKEGKVARQGTMDDIWEADPELYTIWQQTSAVIKEAESTSEDSDDETAEERRRLQRLIEDQKLEIAKKDDTDGSSAIGKLIETEERETGSVSFHVFLYYGHAMGWLLVCLIAFFLSAQYGVMMATDFWLSAWSEAGARLVNVTEEEVQDISEYYIGGYMGLSFAGAFLSYIACAILLCACLIAATKIHKAMLGNICHAPMRFFDTTPVGRILNRFSTDMNTIDKPLSQSWYFFLRALFKCVTALVVNAVVTPVFLAIIFPVVVGYILLQRFFLATSRELQRLESITRSPVYAKFSETLAGLSTIRAYRDEVKFQNTMLDAIDANLTASIYRATATQWLAVRLDFIGAIMVLLAGLTSLTVAILGDLEPSWVGLAIAYALSAGMFLNYLIRHSTMVEMEMNAVERVIHYIHIPTEDYQGVNNPAPTWPQEGSISLDKVSARYATDLDQVLHEVSVHIQAGQKIGICGRTGSGKSSLALALFRLIQINKGKITVDGIDLTSVPLSTLRHRLSIIPQDPMLFTGTIRFNLDPEGSCNDEELWKSLEIAQLKTLVSNLEQGLDSEVSEGGENYSVGERQLFCLARAFLRKTQILIMDEATASIDMETDAILQQVVASAFSDRTVLTIAHRVSSILNSDMILVLQDGHVVEYDTPSNLLANEDSVFASFVKTNH
ncbi:ATP-binding cassette sub-family C member 9-like [Amphiura filiformis]|uniref:ATP-binding cassette sub-family C member 9-like n=1 Tax=Amphiura filiformis TaxID=82378 RepID=UPI003B2152D3